MISEPNKPDVDDEDEVDEVPNHQEQLLATIRRMKAEGAESLSSSDIPDSTDTPPHGSTMFRSGSRFGR